MGCWNKTCGLSNLPITYGTPVYVFILEKAQADESCYTTSLFAPLLLPFVSEYNDYGGGENSGGIGFNPIMDAIKKNLVETPVGENQYHDIAVAKESFGEEMFFEAVHENRLSVKYSSYNGVQPLTFTMFRKDIVDKILATRIVQRYVGDGAGTHGWGNNYIQYGFSDIVADIKPFIAAVQSEMKNQSDITRYMMVTGLGQVAGLKNNRVTRYLRCDTYRYSRLVDISSLIVEYLEEGTSEALATVEALLVEYLKAIYIDEFMSCTRKSWIPGGHEGSQDVSFDDHRLMAQTIIAALDAEELENE